MANRMRRMLRPPRKLIFTPDGRWFVIMTLLVGFGAVNTGNNLLYLLLGMMLGLIIVSGILSEWMLQKVTVRRIPPGDLFAGKTSRMSYEIENAKKVVSSYSITIQEHESVPTRESRRIARGLPAERPRRRKDREAEGDPGGPRALAMRIAPGRSTVVLGEYVFPRRGLYAYAGLNLGTRFPFGFFEKLRPIYEPSEVLVYPEILTTGVDSIRNPALEGEVDQAYEGRSGDFFGLREFREGDDRRDVHWKVSARRNQLVRRLYEKQDNEAVAVHLYNWAPPVAGNDAAREKALVDAVEYSISRAATLCAQLVADGHRFSLHTIDEYVPEGSGAGQLKTVLRQLALLEIRREAEPPPMPTARIAQRVMIAPDHAPATIHSLFSTAATRRAA
jgi:uncharacterized protein (DUF58 family)